MSESTNLDDLRAYYDRLAKHDWFYEYANGRAYYSGLAVAEDLIRESKEDPDKAKLYNGFKSYYFSGRPFNTEKQPKPERP